MTDMSVSKETMNIEDFIRLARKVPDLAEDEERVLLDRANLGDQEAKDTIIEAYLKMVINIAEKLVNRGIPFIELINEGIGALSKAIHDYDTDSGVNFSEYATTTVLTVLHRLISRVDRSPKIPEHLVQPLNEILKAGRDLMAELHREPTIKEIAEKLGKTPEEIEEIMSWICE